MKKLLLSLCLMPLLAYGTQEEKKELVGMTYNQKAGLWQQLTAKRPAEQDLQTKMPWFGSKQLEVNLSQLTNLSMTFGSVYGYSLVNKHDPQNLYRKTRTNEIDQALLGGVAYGIQREQYDKLALPLKTLGFITFLYSGYKYLYGEQKWPFRIVDAEEAH